LARLTFTQRTIEVPLAIKPKEFRDGKSIAAVVNSAGKQLVAGREEGGLTQTQLAEKTGIPRKWIGRWERGRAMANQAQWNKLATVLDLPTELKSLSLQCGYALEIYTTRRIETRIGNSHGNPGAIWNMKSGKPADPGLEGRFLLQNNLQSFTHSPGDQIRDSTNCGGSEMWNRFQAPA
jgi:transcriptional regulator with XRE-family HTH domain